MRHIAVANEIIFDIQEKKSNLSYSVQKRAIASKTVDLVEIADENTHYSHISPTPVKQITKRKTFSESIAAMCTYLQRHSNCGGYGVSDLSLNPVQGGKAYEINFKKDGQAAHFIVRPDVNGYRIEVAISHKAALNAAIKVAGQASGSAFISNISSLRDFIASCEAFNNANIDMEIKMNQPEAKLLRQWIDQIDPSILPGVTDKEMNESMPSAYATRYIPKTSEFSRNPSVRETEI